ncbi:Hsp20/alpha crystallin family protein [Oceanicoccus sp. KOV_DT_Chl]|uniref:Hsp20/alpha crystallin family protein n=1 Tax=Oceanicoccus sp. KOV_DT_Chl TaxID=1904639 RepID=UPI000C7E1D5E|nr:Hsp20/alpha crystallin family protein [Oceanicoccus sp. KOV_DT_Chl]
MNTTQRSPFIDLDNFFNGYYQPRKSVAQNTSTKHFSPKVDVFENEDSYELVAELAGVNKENISVTINDSVLTIEADNSINQEAAADEKSAKKLLRKERFSGKFSRSFNLGQDINEAEINAEFKDGLLTLVVPKIKEALVQARRIDIH